jgi:predicted peptidase
MHIGSLDLPPEFGVDPAVVAEWSRSVDQLFKDQMFSGLGRTPDTAVLFAGLSELKPGGEPATDRTGPAARDQQWWYGLKKQTGNLRTDYYLHLPASYDSDPNKKWPLILFLHGSGERGYDVKAVTNTGLPHNVERDPGFPFIVVAPQCSPAESWSPWELNDLLDRVEAKYRVDSGRVYLTGLSMGGYGSWKLAIDTPGRFAAVAPICGAADPDDAARIKDVPVWAFHGGKDPTVPIQWDQAMVDALKKAGGNVKFTIFPEAAHDSWTQAYAMPELYDWMLRQHGKGN